MIPMESMELDLCKVKLRVIGRIDQKNPTVCYEFDGRAYLLEAVHGVYAAPSP